MKKIDELEAKTAQYAVEHIKGKGQHTGIAWLRDSFNELCEGMHANEWKSEDIGFELNDIVDNLKQEPWVAEIARKAAYQRKTEDINKVVNDFICKYWSMRPAEVTSKDVADILKVADPLSHRHLVGQKVAIACIHALTNHQLEKLDEVLRELAMNPTLGISGERR